MSDDRASRDRVLDAATRLFAERGYDGASTREVGRASGLNIATVAYHVGAKADLYREVMRRAYEQERAALEPAVADLATADDLVQGAQTLVQRYLDFCLDHPHIPALWMRRWLSDAADITGPEAEYAWPLAGLVRDALHNRQTELPNDFDIDMALWTVTWSIHGFCLGGVVEADGKRHKEDEERYRGHLTSLVGKLLKTGNR